MMGYLREDSGGRTGPPERDGISRAGLPAPVNMRYLDFKINLQIWAARPV
jgi:hypothetical protein